MFTTGQVCPVQSQCTWRDQPQVSGVRVIYVCATLLICEPVHNILTRALAPLCVEYARFGPPGFKLHPGFSEWISMKHRDHFDETWVRLVAGRKPVGSENRCCNDPSVGLIQHALHPPEVVNRHAFSPGRNVLRPHPFHQARATRGVMNENTHRGSEALALGLVAGVVAVTGCVEEAQLLVEELKVSVIEHAAKRLPLSLRHGMNVVAAICMGAGHHSLPTSAGDNYGEAATAIEPQTAARAGHTLLPRAQRAHPSGRRRCVRLQTVRTVMRTPSTVRTPS